MVTDGNKMSVRRNFSPENYDQMLNSDDNAKNRILAMDIGQAHLGRSSNASDGKRVVKHGALDKSGLHY